MIIGDTNAAQPDNMDKVEFAEILKAGTNSKNRSFSNF